jgi:hypothetical protein
LLHSTGTANDKSFSLFLFPLDDGCIQMVVVPLGLPLPPFVLAIHDVDLKSAQRRKKPVPQKEIQRQNIRPEIILNQKAKISAHKILH